MTTWEWGQWTKQPGHMIQWSGMPRPICSASCLVARWHELLVTLHRVGEGRVDTFEDILILVVYRTPEMAFEAGALPDKALMLLTQHFGTTSRFTKLRTLSETVQTQVESWWAEEVAKRLAGGRPI